MGSVKNPSPIEPALKDSSFNVPTASYPKASTVPIPALPEEILKIATHGIDDLNRVLESQNYSTLYSLLLSSGGYWRDHLGLSSKKFTTLSGAREIVNYIEASGEKCNILKFALEGNKGPVLGKLDIAGTIASIQVYVIFETQIATGRGLITWIQDVDDGDRWKIFTIFTTLDELKGFPFATGETRPLYANPHDVNDTKNWKDYREEELEFKDAEPAVLIVGAGHSGLMTAARLNMLGVPNLIIDTNERAGDSWRKRYHTLVLHDPCWMNAMPYLPYPPNWPVYASKDKLADFLEYYVSALDLNLWNSTELVHSQWHDDKKHWTVVLETQRKGYKETRTFHPRHLVQATGLNGEPQVPDVPGMQDFHGDVKHSSGFSTMDSNYTGKKVIVVGTGNSGHDIAHDAYRHGASVTLIQRSHTYVVSLGAVLKMLRTRYNDSTKTEDADIISAATPTALSKRQGGDLAAVFAKHDSEILDGLKRAGFAFSPGPELPAVVQLTIHRAGGFYIDTGTSSLIASGAIKIKQGQEISHLTSDSMVFVDGTAIEADEIIFATGYANGRTRTRKVFGDVVADAIDPIWGFDEQGEIRGVWRRSGQEGFWVAAGSLWISRYYSRLLALQIKMIEEGLVGL